MTKSGIDRKSNWSIAEWASGNAPLAPYTSGITPSHDQLLEAEPDIQKELDKEYQNMLDQNILVVHLAEQCCRLCVRNGPTPQQVGSETHIPFRKISVSSCLLLFLFLKYFSLFLFLCFFSKIDEKESPAPVCIFTCLKLADALPDVMVEYAFALGPLTQETSRPFLNWVERFVIFLCFYYLFCEILI